MTQFRRSQQEGTPHQYLQPDQSVPVEAVLLAVGDRVGHANLAYASRMNRGVVVFLKKERLVAELIVSGVMLNGVYLQASPLAVPSTRVTVSGVSLVHPQCAAGEGAAAFREAGKQL